MFFDGWSGMLRTLIVGVVAYIGMVFFLRISGKRTLSKLDPFDFVISTALGSALAQAILSRDVALLRGLFGFAVIIAIQYVVMWLSKRYQMVRHLIKGDPALLFYNGEYLRATMKREHVPEIEILASVREHGLAAIEDVLAVVLEADSGFSVIKKSETKSESALSDVVATGSKSNDE
ncbi:MAG: hypothetical protein AUG51_00500 [Acidobacteria bacterium 13_1_20CM_3_53_8]|nr:MAG: hypothetical protein AUG51_00500 [Acidobacteria bacterium 13_1_20CM_3_53_8]